MREVCHLNSLLLPKKVPSLDERKDVYNRHFPFNLDENMIHKQRNRTFGFNPFSA
jgi:hypothetical protein